MSASQSAIPISNTNQQHQSAISNTNQQHQSTIMTTELKLNQSNLILNIKNLIFDEIILCLALL